MERMQKRLLLATILAAKDWRGLARSISVNVFFGLLIVGAFVYGLVMIPVALDSLPPPAGKVVASILAISIILGGFAPTILFILFTACVGFNKRIAALERDQVRNLGVEPKE